MKELSIEQKAKKYDKALERAKKEWLNNLDGAYKNYRERLEFIFPELKNNKKEWIEKIRQELKSYLEHRKIEQISESDAVNQWIDWIKKQGKQEEPQVYDTGDGEVITYSETEGYRVVGPKFHEGDWIVFNGLTLYIKEVVNGYYRTISFDGINNSYDWDIDNIARLWIIQDARDGDVLTWDDTTCVVLFKNIKNSKCFISYCFANNISFEIGASHYIKGCHPANKEQRDLLFQKMKEFGYVWDSEKKELRKVEQNPTAWSDEDEHRVKDAIYFLDTAKRHYASTVELDGCIDWFKSLKQRIGG